MSAELNEIKEILSQLKKENGIKDLKTEINKISDTVQTIHLKVVESDARNTAEHNSIMTTIDDVQSQIREYKKLSDKGDEDIKEACEKHRKTTNGEIQSLKQVSGDNKTKLVTIFAIATALLFLVNLFAPAIREAFLKIF